MQYQVEAQRIYYADPSGAVLAEITFPEVEPGVYCIDHTVVDDSLRGQGIAGQLVQMAVEQIQAKAWNSDSNLFLCKALAGKACCFVKQCQVKNKKSARSTLRTFFERMGKNREFERSKFL